MKRAFFIIFTLIQINSNAQLKVGVDYGIPLFIKYSAPLVAKYKGPIEFPSMIIGVNAGYSAKYFLEPVVGLNYNSLNQFTKTKYKQFIISFGIRGSMFKYRFSPMYNIIFGYNLSFNQLYNSLGQLVDYTSINRFYGLAYGIKYLTKKKISINLLWTNNFTRVNDSYKAGLYRLKFQYWGPSFGLVMPLKSNL
jgi:hypothetical protein